MAKKEYFGEETKKGKPGRKPGRKAKETEAPKRKYTRRKATKGARTGQSPLVTIEVPANLAFQLGLQIGAAQAQAEQAGR